MPTQLTTTTPFVLLTASLCVLGAQLLLAGAATHTSYTVAAGRVADKRGGSFSDGIDSYRGIHLVGSTTEYMTPQTAFAALTSGDAVTLWVGHNDLVQEVRIDSGQSSGKLFTTDDFRATSSRLALTDGIRQSAGALSLGMGVVLLWFLLTGGRWRPTEVRSVVGQRWHTAAVINPARSLAVLGTAFVVAGLIFWPIGLWLLGSVDASGGFGQTGPNFPMDELGVAEELPHRAAQFGVVGGVAGLISLGVGPRTRVAYWALCGGVLLAVSAVGYLVLGAFVFAGTGV